MRTLIDSNPAATTGFALRGVPKGTDSKTPPQSRCVVGRPQAAVLAAGVGCGVITPELNQTRLVHLLTERDALRSVRLTDVLVEYVSEMWLMMVTMICQTKDSC